MGCARELYCLPRAPGMIQNRRVSARRCFARPVIVNRVRFVIRRVSVDPHAMHAVTLEIMVRAGRTVNRNLMEIRPTKTTDLCIGIGEQTSLQQRIVGEVQSRHDMPRMESRLFVFSKEVIRVAIEHHFADTLNGHQFFRDKFAGSRRSKSNLNSSSSGINWKPSSYSGKSPASMASHNSRRWKSGSRPVSFCASSQTSEALPASGFQWKRTNVAFPSALIRRKV